MPLNSVFSQSKLTRLIMLSVSHSLSKFLSFKVKFIMGLCPISLTNFICWLVLEGYHAIFQNSKISYFSLIFLMLQCSRKISYGYRCPKWPDLSNDLIFWFMFGWSYTANCITRFDIIYINTFFVKVLKMFLFIRRCQRKIFENILIRQYTVFE